MALGLFDRQKPIGLEVPDWLTVFVGHPGRNMDIKELVGGAATMGCRGVTAVFSPGEHFDGAGRDLRNWAAGAATDHFGAPLGQTRPYFQLVACDTTFFNSHREDVEAGRAVYFLGSTRPEGFRPPEPPGGLGGGDGCVVLDMLTTVVGQSRRPHGLLAAAEAAEWEGPSPWRRPNWEAAGDKALASSAAVVMALNWLCKPSTYPADGFMYAIDFIDGITARCFNERNLRPRWQERPAAPPPPQPGPPPPESGPQAS